MSYSLPAENYFLDLSKVRIPKLTGTRQAIIKCIKRLFKQYRDFDFNGIQYTIRKYPLDGNYYQFYPTCSNWESIPYTQEELTFIHHKDKLPDLGKVWDEIGIPPVLDMRSCELINYSQRLFNQLGLDSSQQSKERINITVFCTTKNLSMIGKEIPDGFEQEAKDTYIGNEIQLGRYYDSHLDEPKLKTYVDNAIKTSGGISGSSRRLYNSMTANQAKGRIIMIYSES